MPDRPAGPGGGSPPTPRGEVTRLLHAHRGGDDEAMARILELVYDDLRRIAAGQVHRVPAGTMSPSVLVHEAYFRLVDERSVDWADRHHFLAIAARTLRRVAVDLARERSAQKRGGDRQRVDWEHVDLAAEPDLETVLAVDAALDTLAEVDERLVQVVEHRFFGGLSEKESAAILGVTTRTVQRDWARARAWLRRLFEEGAPE